MTKERRPAKSGATEQALRDADYAGQIEAINRSQCDRVSNRRHDPLGE